MIPTKWSTHKTSRFHCVSNSTHRGDCSVIFVILATALVLVGGLVYDGAQILNAKRQASLLAQQAARAGAQAISTTSIYTTSNPPTVNSTRAQTAIAQFLQTHTDWSAEVRQDTVSTTVWLTQPTKILSILGLDSRRVVGTSTARAVQGIRTEGER